MRKNPYPKSGKRLFGCASTVIHAWVGNLTDQQLADIIACGPTLSDVNCGWDEYALRFALPCIAESHQHNRAYMKDKSSVATPRHRDDAQKETECPE
jgi:hypothetical protein